MRILIINGPNLNMLGVREKHLYGEKTYKALVSLIKSHAKAKGVKVKFYQSNCEGDLVTAIQKAYKKIDGIVINPGAYTHTSVALLDALKSVSIPTVEVHITDVNEREDFRKISYIRLACEKTITGQGFDGYLQGIDYLLNK
jgi:3-dehydroquinate dehydratase-2